MTTPALSMSGATANVRTLLLILGSGLVICAIALVGGATLTLSEHTIRRLRRPMVALAAGSLLGASFFHVLPAALDAMGNRTAAWAWVAAGFVLLFVLEQFLQWHQCRRLTRDPRTPRTWLLLLANGLHHCLCGLSVGGAFAVDARLGGVALFAAAAHEVPQELGNFGVLMDGGWDARKALAANAAASCTFLVGGILAWAGAHRLDLNVGFLLALGAGNFLYVAGSDLVPEIRRVSEAGSARTTFGTFLLGLLLLLAVRWLFPERSLSR
jgi:zinc and cadmium transporter